ncbi:hypothetical protein LIER_13943 [Lithospermum erythrorhizon]|uniref:Uncharacterized protein n=1 Tax=Lithospermum erythrorhizon TaxID=34254 RepID=A0AAV3PYT0_LITER
MPSIDTSIALHKLHVDSMYVPIKQKKRTFSDEKNQTVRVEVELQLKADGIRELQFPKWIANVVLVKKLNRTWWMCTDFASLNKACPKDLYSLPCLPRLVDGNAVTKSLISWTLCGDNIKLRCILKMKRKLLSSPSMIYIAGR